MVATLSQILSGAHRLLGLDMAVTGSTARQVLPSSQAPVHVCEGRGSKWLGTLAGKGSEITAGVELAGSDWFWSQLSLTHSPAVPGREG